MSTACARPLRRAIRLQTLALGGLLLGAMVPTAASGQYQGQDSYQDQGRYGYYRIVEGTVSVVQSGSTQAAQENQPLLTGDRLWTGRGARAEAVLANGTVLRLGGDSEVGFDQLADSGDSGTAELPAANLLTLARGELQLVTDASADTRVDADNATVYLRDAGTYRVESRDGTTLLVVRAGSAELRTPRGATTVEAGEEAWVEGDAPPEVEAAGSRDVLETWAGTLDDRFRRTRWDDDYVDPSLAYDASRMADYGSWVTVSNRRCWRPRVAAGWSPYRDGRWTYTPSGLTWVSYEPWGWVPYHYGSWDYTPGWGWAWYPGRSYAPAWVYWYWGPSNIGWCPIGYYSHFYGPRVYVGLGFDFTFGFGFGIHGWAGGSPRHFDHWNFVDCHNLYDHRLASHTRSAAQLGARDLPRGVISTVTRGLSPGVATRPSEGMRRLANGVGYEKPLRTLPDVSRFVARDPNLSRDIARVALPVDPGRGARTVGGPGGARTLRTLPAEKPAMVTGTGGRSAGVTPPGGGREAVAVGRPSGSRGGRPTATSGESTGTPGRAAVGTKPGARAPSGGAGTVRVAPGGGDEGWRGNAGSAGGREGATKPAARPRPEGNGPDGDRGRGMSSGATRLPARDATGAAGRGADGDGWRAGGGLQARPSAGATASQRPSWESVRPPRASADDWRTSPIVRSPVRRIVEGVRDRQEPARPEPGRSGSERPTTAVVAPAGSHGATAQPTYRPQPSSHESVRGSSSHGESRGTARDSRGDRGGHGSRGGAGTTRQHGSHGDSGPNRR